MRIISGSLKGKTINYLKNSTTRPLKDLVKENIFNIITHSNLFKVDLNNSNVLDLYSGVGSFGIECLSRGVRKVTFVENDLNALITLKKNLTLLSLNNRAEVIDTSVECFLKKEKVFKYDFFFLIPLSPIKLISKVYNFLKKVKFIKIDMLL